MSAPPPTAASWVLLSAGMFLWPQRQVVVSPNRGTSSLDSTFFLSNWPILWSSLQQSLWKLCILCSTLVSSHHFFFYFFFLISFFFFVVNFVIYWNEKALGSIVFPIPIPPLLKVCLHYSIKAALDPAKVNCRIQRSIFNLLLLDPLKALDSFLLQTLTSHAF